MAAIQPSLPQAQPPTSLSETLGPSSPECPVPLLDEWRVGGSSGYLEGRICGNWTAAPNQRCCLPCPAPDWLYENVSKSLVPTSILAVVSLVSCIFLLLLLWLALPKDRTGRHPLGVGLVSALAVVSLAFTLQPNSTTSSRHPTCADPITPHSLYSSRSCGASGILFQFGALSAGLWALFTAVYFHQRIVWSKQPGKTFETFASSVAIMIPIIVLGATIARSGYAYGVGGVCIVEHAYAGALFYGLIVGISVAGLTVMSWTIGHCTRIYIHEKKHGPVRKSLVLDGGALQPAMASSRLQLLLSEWRDLLLGVLLPIEFLVSAAILWSTDQHLTHAAHHRKMHDFIGCLIANNGHGHQCSGQAKGILPPQSGVAFAIIITSILGLQVVVTQLSHLTLLNTLSQVLRHPLKTLRDGRYPPLSATKARTSLSSQSTLPTNNNDFPAHEVDPLHQPSGSLRHIGRRPSLASRIRSNSLSQVVQLSDLKSHAPSLVPEEGDPYGGARPEGVNPYGYDEVEKQRNRSVVVIEGNAYAHQSVEPLGRRDSLKEVGWTVAATRGVALTTNQKTELGPLDPNHACNERPPSPVSPVDAFCRRSWFRESIFTTGDNCNSSRPVSPGQTSPIMSSQPPIMPVPPPPAHKERPSMPRHRSLTAHVARQAVPAGLISDFRKTQTEDSEGSPRLWRNASVSVQGSPKLGTVHEGSGENPLRMNAVEPFRSRRFSQV